MLKSTKKTLRDSNEIQTHNNLACKRKLKKSANFGNLNINYIINYRKYWKTVKSFFNGKCKTSNNVILTGKNETLNNNRKISNSFNKYFTNITKT